MRCWPLGKYARDSRFHTATRISDPLFQVSYKRYKKYWKILAETWPIWSKTDSELLVVMSSPVSSCWIINLKFVSLSLVLTLTFFIELSWVRILSVLIYSWALRPWRIEGTLIERVTNFFQAFIYLPNLTFVWKLQNPFLTLLSPPGIPSSSRPRKMVFRTFRTSWLRTNAVRFITSSEFINGLIISFEQLL